MLILCHSEFNNFHLYGHCSQVFLFSSSLKSALRVYGLSWLFKHVTDFIQKGRTAFWLTCVVLTCVVLTCVVLTCVVLTDVSQHRILFFFHKLPLKIFPFTNVCTHSVYDFCYRLYCQKSSRDPGIAREVQTTAVQRTWLETLLFTAWP